MITFEYDALDVSVVTGTLITDHGVGRCGVTGATMRY